MKIYMAGPLFTVAERLFNAELAKRLRFARHQVRLPQELDSSRSPGELFGLALDGISWSDVVIACLDGADPDSGTAAECGYARAVGRPIVAYRTDFRAGGDGGEGEPDYNLMLAGAATLNVVIRFEAVDPEHDLGSVSEGTQALEAVADRILEALRGLKKRPSAGRPGRR